MESLDDQIRQYENQIMQLERLRKTISWKNPARKKFEPQIHNPEKNPSRLEDIDREIHETYQHLSVLKIRRMMNL